MISVVIPLYNKEKQIKRTLQSILAQTFQDFEIVIVNDGSTDNSTIEVEKIKDETLKEVEKLNVQISDYEGQIETLDEQIVSTNKKIEDAQTKLQKAQKDYKNQEKLLKERLVASYEAGETSYLDFLLSSESLTDLISNYYLVEEIASYDAELLDKIEKEKKEIEQESGKYYIMEKTGFHSVMYRVEMTCKNHKTLKKTLNSLQMSDLDLYTNLENEEILIKVFKHLLDRVIHLRKKRKKLNILDEAIKSIYNK